MYSPNLVGLDIKNYLYNKEKTRLKAGLPTSRSSLASSCASADHCSPRLAIRPSAGAQPVRGRTTVSSTTAHNITTSNSPHTCRVHPNKKRERRSGADGKATHRSHRNLSPPTGTYDKAPGNHPEPFVCGG